MKNLKNILFVLALLILDQLTKFYFIGKNIKIFEYFSFNFTANTGIVFGFFKGMNLIFIFTSLIIICFVIYFYREKKLRLGFNFILAGAFGNLIDRIFRGYVVDFIDLKIWPVFNLADAFIVIGVLLLIYFMWKEK